MYQLRQNLRSDLLYDRLVFICSSSTFLKFNKELFISFNGLLHSLKKAFISLFVMEIFLFSILLISLKSLVTLGVKEGFTGVFSEVILVLFLLDNSSIQFRKILLSIDQNLKIIIDNNNVHKQATTKGEWDTCTYNALKAVENINNIIENYQYIK